MKDRDGEIMVKLYYGVFEEFDLITRAVCVENLGEEEVYLERALSCCVDQTCGNWDWMTFYGNMKWNDRFPVRKFIMAYSLWEV